MERLVVVDDRSLSHSVRSKSTNTRISGGKIRNEDIDVSLLRTLVVGPCRRYVVGHLVEGQLSRTVFGVDDAHPVRLALMANVAEYGRPEDAFCFWVCAIENDTEKTSNRSRHLRMLAHQHMMCPGEIGPDDPDGDVDKLPASYVRRGGMRRCATGGCGLQSLLYNLWTPK